MTRYAVLLRAVNVGGRNKVPMAQLREIAADLGYIDVETYVQSGNLVLTASVDAATIERAVASALRDELAVDVDVMVRTNAELQAVIAANPFQRIADDDAKLIVSFLAGEPIAAASELDPEQFGTERFAVGDRCLYMWLPDGAGRSKLATAPWDRRLGVRGTARNWRTINKLIEMTA